MSRIEWTDVTWNPVRGCSRVSAGCQRCYAERMAARFNGKGKPFAGFVDRALGHWTGRVELIPEKLDEPLHWRKPRRVFVNSMSDLFHEALDFHDVAAVFGVMAGAQRHTFQVLTKRPARAQAFMQWMVALVDDDVTGGFSGAMTLATDPVLGAEMAAGNRGVRFGARPPAKPRWPLPNVWLGVSCEDQQRADERIPLLRQTPAAVRFVSVEPMLEQIDLCLEPGMEVSAPDGARRGIHWVIVGGESGPGARPFYLGLARSVRDQCADAAVPFFFKQSGSNPTWGTGDPTAEEDRRFVATHKHPKGGDPSEWPEDLRVREFPS